MMRLQENLGLLYTILSHTKIESDNLDDLIGRKIASKDY